MPFSEICPGCGDWKSFRETLCADCREDQRVASIEAASLDLVRVDHPYLSRAGILERLDASRAEEL